MSEEKKNEGRRRKPTHLLQVVFRLSILEGVELGDVELDASVGSDGEDSMILERVRAGSVESKVGRHRSWWVVEETREVSQMATFLRLRGVV